MRTGHLLYHIDRIMDIVTPVFLEYRDILIRFIQSRVKDPNDQRDLLSDVMVKLYANADKLSAIRNVEAWLITVAKNTINDYFRDQYKRRSETLPINIVADSEEDLFVELGGCVPALINQLPLKYAKPLSDYELEGIPQKTLAGHYGLSESGLKSRVQRGRKMLKTLFQDACLNELEKGKNPTSCNC